MLTSTARLKEMLPQREMCFDTQKSATLSTHTESTGQNKLSLLEWSAWCFFSLENQTAVLRIFFCHHISLYRSSNCWKKWLTLLPWSSLSVVVNTRTLDSSVRYSQMLGTGNTICSIVRSWRTILGNKEKHIVAIYNNKSSEQNWISIDSLTPINWWESKK